MSDLTKYEKRIFRKYLNDECSEQELFELDHRYTEMEREKKITMLLEEHWEEHNEPDDFDQQKVLKNIHEQIKDRGKANTHVTRDYFYYFKIAATILIILSVGLFLSDQYLNDIKVSKVVEEVNTVTKSTDFGEKLTVMLPDRSKVILNSNASISYPEAYVADERTVQLTGEAYFEVKKDKDKPFIVDDGTMKVTVLGTAFAMNSLKNTVALVEGKVRVSSLNEAIEIVPGELARYDSNDKGFSKSEFNEEAYLGWKDGVIFINNYNLARITNVLESWYGVEIHVRNVNEHQVFTGKLSNRSLENILEGLCYSLNCKYKIDDEYVEIYQ